MYPEAVPALAADIRARLASALAPVKARAAKGDGVDLSDYVAAAQSLLPDVARLARVPHPGAAPAAYGVLVELVFATDPPDEEDCTIDVPEERIPFDKVADEMLLAIAERRKAEEGVGFVVGTAESAGRTWKHSEQLHRSATAALPWRLCSLYASVTHPRQA
ncbi:hypothetical protein VTO73DRAFT_9571 [Trametes versicolor]